MNELTVVGVRVELPSNQPIVLLKESSGDRYLPIWIGAVEATAIAFAQQGIVPARPLTHDLLKDVLQAVGADLDAVTITELRDGVYYADLRFGDGTSVSARPSDAIALAIRAGTVIYAEESVLEAAGITIPTSRKPRSSASGSSSTRYLRRTLRLKPSRIRLGSYLKLTRLEIEDAPH